MHGLDSYSNLNRKWWGFGLVFFPFPSLAKIGRKNTHNTVPKVISFQRDQCLCSTSRSTSFNNYKTASLSDPKGSVKHLYLWLNLWRPVSHGAERDSELAWLWEGRDVAGAKGSWVLPGAGELEVAAGCCVACYHESCLLIPSDLGSWSQTHQHSAILNLLRLPKIPGVPWAYSH